MTPFFGTPINSNNNPTNEVHSMKNTRFVVPSTKALPPSTADGTTTNNNTQPYKIGKLKADPQHKTYTSAITSENVTRPPPTVHAVMATTVRPSCTSLSHNKRVTRIRQYMLLGQCVGKGNFARVELTEHTTLGCRVALKIIDTSKVKEDYVLQNLEREARMLMRLSHPNIVSLFETFRADRFYILALEFVNGKDLVHYIKCQPKRTVPEEFAQKLFGQLVSAVKHMHDLHVVHRDLKLENILLDESEKFIKVVDFGLSNEWSQQHPLLTNCGSPEYAAPELYKKGHPYGPEIDVWSLGIILYGMIVGSLPFSIGQGNKYVGENKENLRHQIANGLATHHRAKLRANSSKPLRDMIQQLICVDAKQRITVPGIVSHQWMRSATATGTSAVPLYTNIFPHPVDEKVTIINKLADILRMPAHSILQQLKAVNNNDILASCDSLKTLFRILLLDNRRQVLLGNNLHRTELANRVANQLEIQGTPTIWNNAPTTVPNSHRQPANRELVSYKNDSDLDVESNRIHSISAQANSFSNLILQEEQDVKQNPRQYNEHQQDETSGGFFGIHRPPLPGAKATTSTPGPFRRKMERMFSMTPMPQPSAMSLAHPSQQQTHALESHTALAHINHTHMTNYNSVLPANAKLSSVRLRASRSAAGAHGGDFVKQHVPPISAAQVILESNPTGSITNPQLFSTLLHHDRQQRHFQQQIQHHIEEAKQILDSTPLPTDKDRAYSPKSEQNYNYRNAPQPWRRKYAVNRMLSSKNDIAAGEAKNDDKSLVLAQQPQQRPFSTSILSSTARQLRSQQQQERSNPQTNNNIGTRLHSAHTVASKHKLQSAAAVEQQHRQRLVAASPTNEQGRSKRAVSGARAGDNMIKCLQTINARISPTPGTAPPSEDVVRLTRATPHKGANYARNGVAYMAFRSPLFAKTSVHSAQPETEQQSAQDQRGVSGDNMDMATNMEQAIETNATSPPAIATAADDDQQQQVLLANEREFPHPKPHPQSQPALHVSHDEHWKVDQTLHALHQVPHPYVNLDLAVGKAVLNKPAKFGDEEQMDGMPESANIVVPETNERPQKRPLPPMSRMHMQAIHNTNAKLRREFFYEAQEVKFLQDLVPSSADDDDDHELVLSGRGDQKPTPTAKTVATGGVLARPSKLIRQRLTVSPRFGASIAVNTHPSIRFGINAPQRSDRISQIVSPKPAASSKRRHTRPSAHYSMGSRLGIPPLVYAEMLQARNSLSRNQLPYNTLQIQQNQRACCSAMSTTKQYGGLASRQNLSPVPIDTVIKFRNRIKSLA